MDGLGRGREEREERFDFMSEKEGRIGEFRMKRVGKITGVGIFMGFWRWRRFYIGFYSWEEWLMNGIWILVVWGKI